MPQLWDSVAIPEASTACPSTHRCVHKEQNNKEKVLGEKIQWESISGRWGLCFPGIQPALSLWGTWLGALPALLLVWGNLLGAISMQSCVPELLECCGTWPGSQPQQSRGTQTGRRCPNGRTLGKGQECLALLITCWIYPYKCPPVSFQ